MIFNFNKFVVDIDIDKTKKFYDKLPDITYYCSCRNCCNYILVVKDFPNEVIKFFEKLGICITKATEVYAYKNKNKKLYYEGFYHICGELIKGRNNTHITHKDEFTILDDNDYYLITNNYAVWFTNDIILPEDTLPTPAFQMEIHFSEISFKIDDEMIRK